MAASNSHPPPRSYGTNASYIYEYSRGLDGVDVPKDVLFTRIIYGTLITVAFCILCGRAAQFAHSKLRLLTAVTASKREQTIWSIETSWLWATAKKHILYAPLGRKRHNREIQLSSAVNVGTLPSRFQTILIVLYAASQIAYCAYLDYNVNVREALIAELRGRSGNLAVLNMVPLFVLAARNNPLIPLLQISFNTYNLLHRWLGRIVVTESVVHVVAWAVNACHERDVSDMARRLRDIPFFRWGLVGAVCMVFLASHSPSPIRHAFYETFLHLHQLAALLVLVGVHFHLSIDNLPQKRWINAIICIWVVERTARLLRLLYLNFTFRNGVTRAEVQALDGEACLVTFHLPRRVSIPAGSYVYAYIPCVSWWMSHPFSVAWAEDSVASSSSATTRPRSWGTEDSESTFRSQSTIDLEKQKQDPFFPTTLNTDPDELPLPPTQTTTKITLLIAARQGMTRDLYYRARSSNTNTFTLNPNFQTTALLEGPYHPTQPTPLPTYGTTILFSAGTGITHHLPQLRHLLALALADRAATRRIHLLWSVRSPAHLNWVKPFMDALLRVPGRRDVLSVRVFVSRPGGFGRGGFGGGSAGAAGGGLLASPSRSVSVAMGRCRPGVVLDEILPGRVGAAVVSVCGPGGFADEVRGAVRERVGKGAVVDFVEEAFSW